MFLSFILFFIYLFFSFFFFFNDPATTEIYTLSLHDALPICNLPRPTSDCCSTRSTATRRSTPAAIGSRDRKSTRLNSSHANISYAVFCLKKKNTNDSGKYYKVQ